MTIMITDKAITEKNIFDVGIDYKVDEISLTLPIDVFTATVHISEDLAALFKYNSKFEVYDNTVKKGVFYTRSITENGASSYLLKGYSSVGVLAERNFPGKMFRTDTGGYYSFGDAVAEIIDYGVPYQFEDEAEFFDVRGFIGHCSQREAVRHLCCSNGVTAYTKEGVLTFRRSFGGAWSGTINNQYAYQQDEVFDDYSVKDSTLYSKYSCDVYTFVDTERDEYVTDPSTGKKYYYYTTKVTEYNYDFPENRPQNELYLQGEMMITNNSFASEVLANMAKFYKGGISVDFRVIDDEHKNYGVGFYDNEKMIFGYPSQVSLSFGRENSIQYQCNMAYTEDARAITVNYKNSSGDLLASKIVYKGSENTITVKHPLIIMEIDRRHKVIYKTSENQNTYEDDIAYPLASIDVVCEVAIIQDGDIVELSAVDYAEQKNVTLAIGGSING